MQIYAHINEPIVRRTFRKHVTGTRGLTVYDKKLRGFGLKSTSGGKKPSLSEPCGELVCVT